MRTPWRNAMWALACAGLLVATAGCGVGDAQQRLRTAVDAEREQLDGCFAEALERDRNLTGDMVLQLHVSRQTGEVEEVEVDRSDVGDATLEQCVRTTLAGVRLEEAPRANLQVQYTLRFVPTS
ncbi:MAG: AgmX/PglI C-terminal domain-containing protein [Myxococcota bacterium]